MRFRLLLLSTLLFSCGQQLHADLCDSVQDAKVGAYAVRDVNIYQEVFPGETHRGNRKWNEILVECNRTRDNNGNEILRALLEDNSNDLKKTLNKANLDHKVIRGQYRFFGTAAGIVTSQKYVYSVGKKDGVWELVLPYKAELNDLVRNRVDFYQGYKVVDTVKDKLGPLIKEGPAWELYDSAQLVEDASQMASTKIFTLINNPKPIAESLCDKSTYFAGKESKYAGQSGMNAHKRDQENKHISLGKIQYYYKKQNGVFEGCRVKKEVDLFWRSDPTSNRVVRVKPFDWVLDNFVRINEAFWSIDDVFTLKVLIKGHNDHRIPVEARNVLQDNDYLTAYFATRFRAREMYKSNLIMFNNFSTMSEDQTLIHELGHALGLDDEYGKSDKKGKPKDNHCDSKLYKDLDSEDYTMCDHSSVEARTIYHYIAVSRYGTKQSECAEDSDCENNQFCKLGTALTKNQCLPKRPDGEGCVHFSQCSGGACNVRCYTPDSKDLNQSCNLDAECSRGTCSAAGWGVTPGKCVCTSNGHCGQGQYCNKGVAGIGTNVCKNKLADGALCTQADQCTGGSCNLRCFTANSKQIGQSCNVSGECSKGQCSGTGWGAIPGKCVCSGDNDCSGNQYCYKGVAGIGTNVCKARLDLGKACTKGGQCKSNCCKIYFGIPQCRPAGKCD